MFPNLRAEMARNKLTSKAMSGMVGIAPESMQNKLLGKTEFKLGEMLTIRSIFPGCSLDYLFTNEESEDDLRGISEN